MAGTNPKDPIKATPADISALSKKLFAVYNWPKINIDDDKQVEDRINLYFDYCVQAGLKPMVEGLALALGISRKTLYDWESGYSRLESSPTRSDMVKKAKDYIAFLLSNYAMDNKVFPATWIFYAKNFFGMTDKQEIEIMAKSPLDELPMDEIEKRIPKNLPVDVEYKEE
jgi:hypothetical protein